MPRYKCHKVVHALKIKSLKPVSVPEDVEASGDHILTPADEGHDAFLVGADWFSRFKGKPYDFGYYVVYADGYKSWSPAAEFEAGYTRL